MAIKKYSVTMELASIQNIEAEELAVDNNGNLIFKTHGNIIRSLSVGNWIDVVEVFRPSGYFIPEEIANCFLDKDDVEPVKNFLTHQKKISEEISNG